MRKKEGDTVVGMNYKGKSVENITLQSLTAAHERLLTILHSATMLFRPAILFGTKH